MCVVARHTPLIFTTRIHSTPEQYPNPREVTIASIKRKHQAARKPQPLDKARRRILWRTIITYQAVYINKAGITITIHSLTPLPKKRTMRASGGNRSFTRTQYTKTKRKVLIVAKSAKKASKTKDEILDDELETLEDLEDLDDLDDLEDEDIEDEDEDDLEDDEDEDEDDEDEDDDESDELEDLTVKELRTKAREDGHAPSTIKGKNKAALIDLINEGPAEDDEDEDEEEVEEAPKSKKSSKKGKAAAKAPKKKSTPSKSRTTDGKVGVQEVAEAAGTTPRALRMLLRKHGIQKDEDVARYEWSSLNHPEVKKVLKLVKEGGIKKAQKGSLDKLKSSKKGKQGSKKGGAKRSKKKAA